MNVLRRLLGLTQTETTKVSPDNTSATTVDMPDSSMLADTLPSESTLIQEESAATVQEKPGFGATRQLPPLESALTRPNQHITYGQSTDVGMVRSNNQDSLLTFFATQGNTDNMPDFGVFIVADGMGGHHDGEKASAIATRVLAEEVTRKIYLPMLQGNKEETDAAQPTISEILAEAVRTANDVVVKSVPEGGTTITAAAIIGDLAYIVHVGDSRAYLVTKEYGLEQITRDHSLVQRLIELDQLTSEEASQHPQKNVLYRAIGQSDNLEVDAITRRLPPESYLLLCSDGLWNMVSEEQLMDIIMNAESPQEACNRMVAIANEYGGPDNISAILIQIPD